MTNDDLILISATPSGDDFEDLFWGLLCRKYDQTELVRIKSTMGGDFGIEGYSCDGRCLPVLCGSGFGEPAPPNG